MLQRLLALTLALLALALAGCVGTVIGATTDAVIEVAKVPFKVGGAVIDVATGDDEDEPSKDEDD